MKLINDFDIIYFQMDNAKYHFILNNFSFTMRKGLE